MFRKNKELLEQTQPVVMALTLNRHTLRERIIIGPKQEVQRHMEGKQTQEDLFDLERPLGQLVFDLENEIVGEWNDMAIFELKSALHSRLGRKKYESHAKEFLKKKLASDNAVSVFWARNFLIAYERYKKRVPHQNAADMFEGQAMMLTRLGKNNILPKTGDYAVEDVIERVQTIMCASGYRQDVAVQIFYPWRRCKEEFVLIEDSILAGILWYLNRLLEWNVCFRTCAVCGKTFLATSAHHSLCSDACRKEQNRLNKQAFDMRAQQSICERDYSGSTRRMRDLIKKSKTASPKVCALAQSFYDRFRGEAKKRKKVDYEANQSADAIRAYLERYTHYNNKGLFGFVLSRTVFAALEYASALKNCDCSALLQQILEKEFEEIIPTELDKCVTTETNLLSTQQYAALHKRSTEQVKQYLHQNNRIPGAIRIGRDWVISKDARFPENKRKTNLNKED